MAKIILDAGHGGADPGAVYNGRLEKDDNLRLALAVGELLEQNGAEVFQTRTEDVYDSPFEKAQIANREGGDFFVSFHRNSSPEPNQYSGVEMLVYDKAGRSAGLAAAINAELAGVGFQDLGVEERPNLAVLRRTKMPAVLVETGFLNTDADNRRFDAQFDEIARAIANGILKMVGLADAGFAPEENEGDKTEELPGGSSGAGAQERLYRVQTGAFRSREQAEDLRDRLQRQNYPAFILYDEGVYKVQTGAFRRLDNAVRMEQTLRRQGYPTFITT